MPFDYCELILDYLDCNGPLFQRIHHFYFLREIELMEEVALVGRVSVGVRLIEYHCWDLSEMGDL